MYIADYIVQTQPWQHYNGDTSFKNMLQPMQMNFTAWPVAWLGIRQPEGKEKRFINMILLLFEDLKGWVVETTQTCPPRKRMGTKQSKPRNFLIISNKSFISQNLKVSQNLKDQALLCQSFETLSKKEKSDTCSSTSDDLKI